MSNPAKKKFAVSLVWSKPAGTQTNVANSLRIVDCDDEDQAFSLSYKDAKEELKEHALLFHTIVEINMELTDNQLNHEYRQ